MFTAITGYRVCAAIMTCLLFSLVLFVCSLFVCLFVCFLKVWWRSLKSRVIADNGGHDPEHPRE